MKEPKFREKHTHTLKTIYCVLKLKRGADAIKKFTPILGIPYLGV